MLRAFGHHVATCCDMLGVASSNLKMVKFFMQHLWLLHVVVACSCNNVAPGHAHQFDFNSQNVATRYPNARNMLRPTICCDLLRLNVAIVWPELTHARLTMLVYVALRCCYRLVGALRMLCTTEADKQQKDTSLITLARYNLFANFTCRRNLVLP